MRLTKESGNLSKTEIAIFFVQLTNFKHFNSVAAAIKNPAMILSVARHYGRVQNATEEPVYCIFIAPQINEASLAYFYDKNTKAPKFYGGKTRIVPMNLTQFITFITIAKDKGFNHSKTLKDYLDSIIKENRSVDDETIWFRHIDNSISAWVS